MWVSHGLLRSSLDPLRKPDRLNRAVGLLYWRGMTPKEQRRVPVSLVAAVPGRYVGPASHAYLYYGDEHKAWVPSWRAGYHERFRRKDLPAADDG